MVISIPFLDRRLIVPKLGRTNRMSRDISCLKQRTPKKFEQVRRYLRKYKISFTDIYFFEIISDMIADYRFQELAMPQEILLIFTKQ